MENCIYSSPQICLAWILALVPGRLMDGTDEDRWGAGDTLMESDTVRKIGFTGSTRVGKLLFAAAAETVKKVRLLLLFDSRLCLHSSWLEAFMRGVC